MKNTWASPAQPTTQKPPQVTAGWISAHPSDLFFFFLLSWMRGLLMLEGLQLKIESFPFLSLILVGLWGCHSRPSDGITVGFTCLCDKCDWHTSLCVWACMRACVCVHTQPCALNESKSRLKRSPMGNLFKAKQRLTPLTCRSLNRGRSLSAWPTSQSGVWALYLNRQRTLTLLTPTPKRLSRM